MAERTKIWIAEALKRLMAKKPLEKIHVTDICREAEIERPTFYYHFKDKYDLVAWIFCGMVGNKDITSFQDCVDILNDMQQKYFIFFKRAYKDNSQNALWKCMLEYFVDAYEKAVRSHLNGGSIPAQLSFSIRLYCYGCIGTCWEWFENDKSASSQIMVTMLLESMPQDMKDILLSESTASV